MMYIVTGGCGFIGSNAVDFLVKQGHSVAVIDNLSADVHDKFYFNDKATYYHHDVLDYVMCSEVFNRNKPDVVLHFAAEARIQNCIEDPQKAFNQELNAYSEARARGIQPGGTSMQKIREAEKASEVLGRPYNSNTLS